MAITTLGLTGFEHGFIGAGAQNGGGLFDAAPGSGWSASTSSPRNGSYCAHLVAPATTITRLVNNFAAGQAKVVVRLGIKVTARPASGVPTVVHCIGSRAPLFWITSTGVLTAQILGGIPAQNGPIIDTSNWHLLEFQFDGSTLRSLDADWKVDGVSQPRCTSSGAATTVTGFALGEDIATQPGFTADFDDVIVGTWTVAGTDWYGDGKVLGSSQA